MSAEAIKERTYQELTPNERGWLWCQRLGLWLGTWEGAIEGKPGTWFRFDDQKNNLVLLPEEAAQQQGLQQGACRSLLHLLIARFGEVPQEVTTRLQALDVEQLEDLAEAILTVDSLEQFLREEYPPGQRRSGKACAKGYRGRKRGQVVRTRSNIAQAHTSEWLGAKGTGGRRITVLRKKLSSPSSEPPAISPPPSSIVITSRSSRETA